MEHSQDDSNFAMYFLSSMKMKDLNEFIDKNLLREGSIDEPRTVPDLARKCLRLRGDMRPTMKEVARGLALVVGFGK